MLRACEPHPVGEAVAVLRGAHDGEAVGGRGGGRRRRRWRPGGSGEGGGGEGGGGGTDGGGRTGEGDVGGGGVGGGGDGGGHGDGATPAHPAAAVGGRGGAGGGGIGFGEVIGGGGGGEKAEATAVPPPCRCIVAKKVKTPAASATTARQTYQPVGAEEDWRTGRSERLAGWILRDDIVVGLFCRVYSLC